MQITLHQVEIEEAVYDYVVKQGFNLKNKDITTTFTQARSEKGLTADILINAKEDKNVQNPTFNSSSHTYRQANQSDASSVQTLEASEPNLSEEDEEDFIDTEQDQSESEKPAIAPLGTKLFQ